MSCDVKVVIVCIIFTVSTLIGIGLFIGSAINSVLISQGQNITDSHDLLMQLSITTLGGVPLVKSLFNSVSGDEISVSYILYSGIISCGIVTIGQLVFGMYFLIALTEIETNVAWTMIMQAVNLGIIAAFISSFYYQKSKNTETKNTEKKNIEIIEDGENNIPKSII